MKQRRPQTLLAILGLLVALHVQAQAPTTRPEFEVASVKRYTSGESFTIIRPPAGGRFTASNATLKLLISVAWNMRLYQLSGGPAWMDTEHYDVSAKAEGNPKQDQMLLMLQTMLEGRFQLKLHRDTKEMPVYALVPAKNGPKLKESSGSNCVPIDPNKPLPPPPPPAPLGQPFTLKPESIPCGALLMMGNALEAPKTDMKQFASALTNMGELDRPVIDKTGLTGTFAIHLEYSPVAGGRRGGPAPTVVRGDFGGVPALPDAAGPSIFTALQEQLGLKLEAQKAPIEILVIDTAQKPTEN